MLNAHYTSERIVHGIREYAVQGIYIFLLLLNWHETLFSQTPLVNIWASQTSLT